MKQSMRRPNGNVGIKVCGVTCADDALPMAELGIDAIGFLLARADQKMYPDSDRLSVVQAKQLCEVTKHRAMTVMLVHEVDPVLISAHVEAIRPDAIQIQVALPVEALIALRARFRQLTTIKTIRIDAFTSCVDAVSEFLHHAKYQVFDALLLDSPQPGGGIENDWIKVAQIRSQLQDSPIIVAGGLNSKNVASVVNAVQPDWVDVMSSVTDRRHHRKRLDEIKKLTDRLRPNQQIPTRNPA